MKKLIISLIICIFICINFVSAFNITTDDITQTSITWNLSQKGSVKISEIALDGVILEKYSPNTTRIVQSNLEPNEQHIITVTDENDIVSELSANTLSTPPTETENLAMSINTWIIALLALAFIFSGIFLRFGILAFGGTVFSLIGIISSMGNSFLAGILFFILMAVSVAVGFAI